MAAVITKSSMKGRYPHHLPRFQCRKVYGIALCWDIQRNWFKLQLNIPNLVIHNKKWNNQKCLFLFRAIFTVFVDVIISSSHLEWSSLNAQIKKKLNHSIKYKVSESGCESHRQTVPQQWQIALTQKTSVCVGLGRTMFLLPFSVFMY